MGDDVQPQLLERIVRCTDSFETLPIDEIGGKGFNLLRLYGAAQRLGSFCVPRFFIVPSGYPANSIFGWGGDFEEFIGPEVEEEFSRMRKPVIVRSSSSLEDGVHATFAGMFLSIKDVKNYEGLMAASLGITSSGYSRSVDEYAERMGVKSHGGMAKIVQEQVVNPTISGIIQLEKDRIVIEYSDRDNKSDIAEFEYSDLDLFAGLSFTPHETIGEGDYHLLAKTALKAKEALGFDGDVQVEFCFSPQQLPDFVQIRQLPKIRTPTQELNMEIPPNVPYIESRVVSGVSGELVLPAYVTVSQSGMSSILIDIGDHMSLPYVLVRPKKNPDGRADIFSQQSALAKNVDFKRFLEIGKYEDLDRSRAFSEYEQQWEQGNSLFPEYALICDKLDESVIGMNTATTNKKAIITCLEASKTSHAITVARDLGIIVMGFHGDIMDMGFFYNRVETGDMVHIKSDGRRAVAYIEKKRESNPYQGRTSL